MTRWRPSAIAVSTLAGALTLSACAATTSSLPPETPRPATPCKPAQTLPTIVLSDSTPIPSISVPVGSRFVVVVPRWGWGRATAVSDRRPSVVRELCSVGLNDGGRRTEFQALRPGQSSFGATVTPASDLMMPSWMGNATVFRLSPGVVSPTVSIRLRLGRTNQRDGRTIPGFAYVWNNERRSIVVQSCAFDGWLFVGLESSQIAYDPAIAAVACRPTVHLKPGLNRFPIRVRTTYGSCAQDPRGVTEGHPRCTAHGPPPLPPGRYSTKLVVLGLPWATLNPNPIFVTLRS